MEKSKNDQKADRLSKEAEDCDLVDCQRLIKLSNVNRESAKTKTKELEKLENLLKEKAKVKAISLL